jgi:hypothetical protein
MKSKLSILALAPILSTQLCMAQTNEPADDWKPSTLNQPGQQYDPVLFVQVSEVFPQSLLGLADGMLVCPARLD